jgi:ubiquinone/menaquinone biosynthesis C-methylase UbiE
MRKPLVIARQGRRPAGLLGELVARVMAKQTAAENDMALELLQLDPADCVLEVGSGHGDTLAKAAKAASRGFLSGIDFSTVMHRHASGRHRGLVGEGRVEFRFGSSDRLPYADRAFDKAYAVHTIYFWTTPLEHLGEVHRVLRPGGRFVLGFRPAEDTRFRATHPAEIYCIRPEGEVADFVRRAGFDVVDTLRHVVGAKCMSFVVATANGGRAR